MSSSLDNAEGLRLHAGHSHQVVVHWNLSIVDTIGTQLAVLYTVDLSIEDTIGTQLAVLYTVEPLCRGHHWDPAGCPAYSGTSL